MALRSPHKVDLKRKISVLWLVLYILYLVEYSRLVICSDYILESRYEY